MNKELDRLVLEMRDSIAIAASRLVRIRSVKEPPAADAPFGEGIRLALEEALLIGRELGFTTKNVDNYAGHVQYGDSGFVFGVLGHLDVVPEGEGWIHEPYGGEIDGTRVWGRGATDDKGPMAAALYALKAVERLGITPKNRIRIIFGTDEESDWGGIKYYFKREESPKWAVSPDAGFPIIHAEKGIVSYHISLPLKSSVLLEFSGGSATNVIPSKAHIALKDLPEIRDEVAAFTPSNSAKIVVSDVPGGIRVEAHGVSGHGGAPDSGVNAISPLLHLLSGLTSLESETREALSLLNERLAYDTKGLNLSVAGSDSITGDLTLNLATVALRDSSLEISINIRYPVMFCEEMIYKQIRESLRGTAISKSQDLKPLFVSPNGEFITLLREVFSEVTGEEATLLTMGGGTYARAVPKGVAFGPLLPGRNTNGHRPEEHIDIDDLVLMARVYAQLYYRVMLL